MKYNPYIYKRKSIRLKNYDYSKKGLYFITIGIKNKLCLFGEIKNKKINLFDSGKMVKKYWLNLENQFDNIKLHDFVVMPNHFHGVIEIVEKNEKFYGKQLLGNHKGYPYNTNVGAMPCACPNDNNENRKYKNTIGHVIGGFKSKTTNQYIKNVKNNNWLPFNKKLWQRNYYENIIKNEKMYLQIIEYINNNLLKWDEDKFYYIEI